MRNIDSIRDNAHDKLLYMENYEKETGNINLFMSALVDVCVYIFILGKNGKNVIMEDSQLLKLPDLFESKYKIIKKIVWFIDGCWDVHCIKALKMRSAFHFYMDCINDRNNKFYKMLEEFDNMLKNKTDSVEDYLETYYEIEADYDDCFLWMDHQKHDNTSFIIKTRKIPESHTWWPEFCRKDE